MLAKGLAKELAKANLDHRLQIKLALNNLESAQHFATDIAPLDPRLGMLHELETQLQKLLKP
jgi:hypothetical protein